MSDNEGMNEDEDDDDDDGTPISSDGSDTMLHFILCSSVSEVTIGSRT